MPVAVHKILLHGASVMKSFLIPIGQLSEEVQELRHKDLKNFREHFSRKISRSKTNEDMIHRLLLSSNPVISSLRPSKGRKLKLSGAALKLTIPPKFSSEDLDSESSDDDGNEI